HVPDLLPPEYATELQKLQADAPPMGAAFVRRRIMKVAQLLATSRTCSRRNTPPSCRSSRPTRRRWARPSSDAG
ncbi:hypothetical protein CTI14_70620, partial [Methylobacterium radiotolerans]